MRIMSRMIMRGSVAQRLPGGGCCMGCPAGGCSLGDVLPRIGWGKDGAHPDVEVVLREAVRAVEVPHSCAKNKNAHEWATPVVVGGPPAVRAKMVVFRAISTSKTGDLSLRQYTDDNDSFLSARSAVAATRRLHA